jgi:hypothetical protein
MRPYSGHTLVACALLSTRGAHADVRGASVALSLGYAAPAGSTEQGDMVSDTTSGMIPFAVDGAYRLAPHLGVSVRFQYGVGLPTLCRNGGDCAASLGGDVSAGVGVRYFGPRVGTATPHLDIGVGYEWLTTRLSEQGAASTRAHRGPIVTAVSLAWPFRLGERWAFGPSAEASIGTFTSYALTTNLPRSSGEVAGHALHGWLSVSARLEFAW